MDSGVPVRLCGGLISEWTAHWVGACCRRGCKVSWRVLIPGVGPAAAEPSVSWRILILGWGAWRTLIPWVAVLQALEVLIDVDGVGLSCGGQACMVVLGILILGWVVCWFASLRREGRASGCCKWRVLYPVGWRADGWMWGGGVLGLLDGDGLELGRCIFLPIVYLYLLPGRDPGCLQPGVTLGYP